jgi:hypothetical protein
MKSFMRNRFLVSGVLFATVLFFAQPIVFAKEPGKGNLTGFVYDQDGTTPVEGAVVMLKNLETGTVFESGKSDNLGAFSVTGVDQGVYLFGVTSPRGDFNAEEALGIAANETAKLAVALQPFDSDEVNPKNENAPTIAGEKWIGTVVSYDASTGIARIYINKGQLKQDENFHVKGDKKKYNSDTDFWQKAKLIQQNGLKVKKAVAGQYYNILLEKPPLDNDFVYVKKSRGLAAFFLSPLGLATILAGTTAAVVAIVATPGDASAFKR